MFTKLEARFQALTAARVSAVIAERAGRALPPGVTAEAEANGVSYAGRRLLARFVTDPLIRSYLT